MNRIALIAIGLFIVLELIVRDTIICGVPLWLLGLILFSVIWMMIVGISDKVKIEDCY